MPTNEVQSVTKTASEDFTYDDDSDDNDDNSGNGVTGDLII